MLGLTSADPLAQLLVLPSSMHGLEQGWPAQGDGLPLVEGQCKWVKGAGRWCPEPRPPASRPKTFALRNRVPSFLCTLLDRLNAEDPLTVPTDF